jgi:catechol 2,3-dioxygenase-like lactoylglutathione lyase family enzyme
VPVGAGGVVHVNVNCRDLERSLAFYRDVLGLQPVTRTTPEQPQPGAAFGLEWAQWDAWMMAGPKGFGAPVVDLLQWIRPEPVERDDRGTVGLCRLRVGGGAAYAALADPDGLAIDVRPGPPGLTGVTVACSEPDRSSAFYRSLGLGGFVEVVEGAGTAPPRPNTVGIWRLALATEDIDADVAELSRAGVRCVSDPVEMSMGPGLPVLRFVLFPDPDGTMLELIERPSSAGGQG